MFTIGDVALPFPFMAAPMAGISDLPFRLICRSFGAPLAFTEMVDLTAISHRNKRTERMLSSSPQDRPLGIQFIGNDASYIRRALDVIQGRSYDIIDFNAACPAAKVVRKGKGAALLKEPKKLEAALKELVAHSNAPVTLKIRSGWDSTSVNAREVALRGEDAGISALFIHGRTKIQGYSGRVDYDSIKEVKEALRIPVIASGDNLSITLIQKMFDKTGCDGIAIARGSLGNPWIFTNMIHYFRKDRIVETPHIDERIETMERHLGLSVQFWGEQKAVKNFRKLFVWYSKGLTGAKLLREKVFMATTMDQLSRAINDLRSLALQDHHFSQG